MNETIKPSDQCKIAGLDSLKELVELSGRHRDTIRRWHKHKPELFNAALKAAVLKKGKDNE